MLLTSTDIVRGLEKMGQLALERGIELELSVVGGAIQAFVYRSRPTTKDVDCIFIKPQEARVVRKMAAIVAAEEGWEDDWLNDGPVGFVMLRDELKNGPVILKKPGITVRMPMVEQLLAMKLMAWRDPLDIADATLLLKKTVRESTRWGWVSKRSPIKIWEKVEPYLIPGYGLKAQLAFAELWEKLYGED